MRDRHAHTPDKIIGRKNKNKKKKWGNSKTGSGGRRGIGVSSFNP